MPTYEYRCPAGHDFERFYKTISGAQAEVDCPECGAKAARQLSGGAGLLFKGSGFYLTDYGKNAHRKAAPEKSGDGGSKGEGKAESGSGGAKADASSTSKSESKPDTKPTSAPKAEAPKSSKKPKAE